MSNVIALQIYFDDDARRLPSRTILSGKASARIEWKCCSKNKLSGYNHRYIVSKK